VGTPPATVKVWDLFVHVFQLVAGLAFHHRVCDRRRDRECSLAAGYTIATLLTLRIIWGFIGPAYARFGNFVRSPRAMLAYIRDATLFRAPRNLGNNPVGGTMIIALIATLLATCVAGYMMTSDAYWGANWVERVHGALANATVALIALIS
jgi:cytochrome b